jgi:hypothetical protein
MLPEPEFLESAGTAILVVAAVMCTMRAAFVLIFRVPAKATLTYDGYRRMSEARNSAVLLAERPPMPYTVEDGIAFSTAEGRKMRVTVRRYAKPRDRTLLVWYSPRRPENVSTGGPFYWFAWALGCLGTIVLLFHT